MWISTSNTGLVYAIVYPSGHCDVVRFLLDQGGDVNTADNRNETSLHKAAQEGHLECFRVLISAGADLTAKLSDGRTSLHFAAAG